MSGGRRESRSSLGNRQNDALFEFENFKKKFLLANKHITKLNSTLSVRIEELNAQISMLCVENLRLRASEIALASQLRREREQSQKVLADAEAASQNLTKHICHLRESLQTKGDSGAPPTPPSPKARRLVTSINIGPVSPQFRIARPPNVPGIYEDEEPCISAVGENEKTVIPQPKKSKTKSKLSASKLPLPACGSSPTPPTTGEVGTQRVDLSAPNALTKPRKTIRRQSGLLKVTTESLAVPRSGSPAFGSPIRLEAGLAEEAEEMAAMHHEIEVVVEAQEDPVNTDKKEKDKDKRKGKSKEQRESESEEASREKKRPRDTEDLSEVTTKVKSGLRAALQPIDCNEEPFEVEVKPSAQRQFLRPPSPPQDSSNPTLSEQTDGAAGREKRIRKSVNYAEPKLNTKMRKPDLPLSSEPSRRKRSSAAAVMMVHTSLPSSLVASETINAAANETEMTSSLDYAQCHETFPLKGVNGDYIDPDNFPIPDSRPGSAAAMYSPGPPTRTTGSTASSSSATTAGSSSSAAAITAASGITAMKRKKSRPQLHLSDEDSDGADADAEYVSGNSSAGAGWGNVNIDSGRRRGLPKRSAAGAAVAALEDIRRHSMIA